uniref:Uncharacterized protein n=1 Tax=Triticum urartu TaxID=4572 RepID=A0A8R7UPD4_TRIUA
MEQHVVPCINGPRKAPVHAVAVHLVFHERVGRPGAVLAGMRVRAQDHRLRRVHEHHPHPAGRRPLRRRKLLHLQRAEVELEALDHLLPASVRRPPKAVAVLVPLPALIVRRVDGAQQHRAAEPAVGAGERPQRGPRGHAQRVPHCQVRHVGPLAVVAPDELLGLVQHGRAVEPARRRHHHVVELRHMRRPHLLRLVQVEVPEARVRRPVVVDHLVPDKVWHPEAGHREVVLPVVVHRVLLSRPACDRSTNSGEEADERVLVVPGQRVPDEGDGLAPHHGQEAEGVEAGQVAAVAGGLPPPLEEAQVRPAEPHAVVVLVDDPRGAGVVGVVGRVQVRHPVAPENVTALASPG